VHPANLLVRRVPVPSGAPSHLGWTVALTEFELGLLGATSYAEGRHLAIPRLAVGANTPFTIPREVVAFGHVLYEMVTGKELTEVELSRCVGARIGTPACPGPVAAWVVLHSIFLPAAEVAKGPTIVELLAEPFFSVELPAAWTDAAAAAQPPSFSGRAAQLLKASRKRYGGEFMTMQPIESDGAAEALSEPPVDPKAPAPPVVVVDSDKQPREVAEDAPKKKKKPKNTVMHFEVDDGPLGFTLSEEAGGRMTVATVAAGGQAATASVPVGGTLLAVNDQPTSGLSRKALEVLIGRASRPLVLRIQAPTKVPAKAKAADKRRKESLKDKDVSPDDFFSPRQSVASVVDSDAEAVSARVSTQSLDAKMGSAFSGLREDDGGLMH